MTIASGAFGAGRAAVALHLGWRIAAAVFGGGALIFGGALALADKSDGVAVAAAFALAAAMLIFAVMGVVPASIKVGDIDIKLEQAMEAGRQNGAVAGLQAAGELKDLPQEEFKDDLTKGLTTDQHLPPDDWTFRLPNLGSNGASTAENIAQALGKAAQ
jgi:hypothetical protein